MSNFALDRADARLMGVCAGLSRASGVNVTLVRLAAAISLLLLGPIAVFLYLITAWIAPERD